MPLILKNCYKDVKRAISDLTKENNMKLLKFVVLIIICLLFIRLLTFFIKRFKTYFKLKKECKSLGATLIGTHPLWIFGTRFGTSNDFYIDIQEKVFSVKFFPVNSRKKVLYFNEKGNYFFRKYTVFIGGTGTRATFTNDSKLKQVPQYNFQKSFRKDWYIKEFVPVLLIDPSRFAVLCETTNNKSMPVDAGELFRGMMITRLSDFLRQLEKVNYCDNT